jgi:hypothetical protein
MIKFFKIVGGAFVVALGACAIGAVGSATAKLINDTVRECRQPFKPRKVVVPRSILLKRATVAKEAVESVEPVMEESETAENEVDEASDSENDDEEIA